MKIDLDEDRPDLPWRVAAQRGLVYHFATLDQARAFVGGWWPR